MKTMMQRILLKQKKNRDNEGTSKIDPEDDITEVAIGKDETMDGNASQLEEELFNNEAKEKILSTSTHRNPVEIIEDEIASLCV